MTNDPADAFGESTASFEQGIAPESIDHMSFEFRTKFFPWHKPRKQLLRTEQWGESVGKLVDALSLKEINQPLTYLSLPGPDLLDVRSLQPICQQRDVQLYFLGLNSGEDDDKEGAHLNAALLNQVRSLPGVDKGSDVVPDRFEHLAKKKTIAYERIIAARKSFDVINIDLCRSLAEGVSGVRGPNNVNALYNLLQHQAQSRNQDWILFLTTRSNKDMVDPGTMENLVLWLNNFIDEDPQLLDGMINQGLVLAEELTDRRIDLEKLGPSSYTNAFALGVGHWILDALFDHNPAWRVDMLPQYGYHVAMLDPSCDMLSFGFYCKRIPLPARDDPFGIARIDAGAQPEPREETKVKCRQKVHRRVRESDDVDVKLYKDEDLYQRYLESSARLLSSARYDEGEYRKWAQIEKEKLALFLANNNLV